MSAKRKAWVTDRRILRLVLMLASMLLLLSCLGVLLYLRVNALFSPRESELRVTVSDREETPCLTPTACDGDAGTTFYAFENDQTLIDCGMCYIFQLGDGSLHR